MDVDVRYFAIIREIVGLSAERRELPEGATAGDVFTQLIRENPRLERMRPVTMLMVNKEYVMPDHELHDGDELALIPPVSGGGETRFRVQSEALDPRSTESLVAHPGAGAIATFIGTVRDHARDRAVTHLEYEAYVPAAELNMAQIGDEIRERWGIVHVAIVHRVGSLAVGEASVVISVASAHRDAAFEACRYAIQHYADGATWLGSEHDYQVEIGRLVEEQSSGNPNHPTS